jgi:chromosome segregation ATPase
MKNPLQALLMTLALGLCALCTWQWYSQVLQRKAMTALAQTNYDEATAIQGYTNTINNMDHQMAQLDARMSDLRDTIASNATTIVDLHQETTRLNIAVESYSNAVNVLQAQIKQANESIHQQNEALKDLVSQRDDFVKRLNDSIKERNDIVTKYNELVKQLEQLQAGQSKKQQK